MTDAHPVFTWRGGVPATSIATAGCRSSRARPTSPTGVTMAQEVTVIAGTVAVMLMATLTVPVAVTKSAIRKRRSRLSRAGPTAARTKSQSSRRRLSKLKTGHNGDELRAARDRGRVPARGAGSPRQGWTSRRPSTWRTCAVTSTQSPSAEGGEVAGMSEAVDRLVERYPYLILARARTRATSGNGHAPPTNARRAASRANHHRPRRRTGTPISSSDSLTSGGGNPQRLRPRQAP